MHATLDYLIELFRAAQDVAVAILIDELELPRPASAIEWSRYVARSGLSRVQSIQGIGVRAHGYGVAVSVDGKVVDFDWGDGGEADGFDAWRLYVFTLEHHANLDCSHSKINQWLEAAHKAGELIKSGALYYDPKRRAP